VFGAVRVKRLSGLLFLALLLAACASGPDTRKRDEALYLYASAIRWSDIDAALAFIDPELLRTQPLSSVERARYDQVQVAGYQVKNILASDEDELVQVVEIRLVNRHTQVERIIMDRQRWRWDETAKTWWLMSGLPNIESR